MEEIIASGVGVKNDVMKCPSCGALLVTDEMSRYYRCAFCGLDIDYWEKQNWQYSTFKVDESVLVIFDETLYQ